MHDGIKIVERIANDEGKIELTPRIILYYFGISFVSILAHKSTTLWNNISKGYERRQYTREKCLNNRIKQNKIPT